MYLRLQAYAVTANWMHLYIKCVSTTVSLTNQFVTVSRVEAAAPTLGPHPAA